MHEEGRHARSSFFAQKEGQKQKRLILPLCAAKTPFNASFFGVFAKSDGLTTVYKKKDEAPLCAWQSCPLFSFSSFLSGLPLPLNMPNFLPNVFFCEKKECLKKKWKSGLVLLFFRFSFSLSLKAEKEKQKISALFSSFFFLEKKKVMMQRKRRALKKEKEKQEAEEKEEDAHGPSSALCFASFSPKKKTPFFTQDAGRRRPGREENEKEKEDEKTAKKQMSVSMNVISLLLSLFL